MARARRRAQVVAVVAQESLVSYVQVKFWHVDGLVYRPKGLEKKSNDIGTRRGKTSLVL